MKNFIPQEVVVITNREIVPDSDYYLLRLYWPGHAEIQPGQFLTIHTVCDESTAARPFAIFDWDKESVYILFGKVGKNTEFYSKLKTTDKIMVSGPKGNPVPIDDSCQNYILVAGGRGVAGIYPVAKKLRRMGGEVTVLLGAPKPTQIVCVDMFYSLGCMVKTITDVGPEKTGFVTALFKEELKADSGKSIIITCGPVPMYNEINNLISASGNTGYAFLEQMMTCGGTGASKCCAVFTNDRKVKYVCQDGPAFEMSEVNWNVLMRPHITVPLKSSSKKDNFMEVSLGGSLILSSPIITASGTSDYKSITDGQFDPANVGALEVKGIMFKERSGNPPPRTCEIRGGAINTIGLAGKGIKRSIDEDIPEWQKFKKPIIVNIAGETVEEFGQVASRLKDEKIAGITINASCPNVRQRDIAFGLDPGQSAAVVKAVRQAAGNMFIIFKTTPMAGLGIMDVINAVIGAGADAITIANTYLAMDYDIYTRRPTVSRNWGGQSGPINFHQILYLVRRAYLAHPEVPIIMSGGIDSGEKAIKAHLAGASAIQIGTATFNDYQVVNNIYGFYPQMLAQYGVNNVMDIIGQGDDFTKEEFEQQ